MQANLHNGGRWHHIASEAEINAAMRDRDKDVIEVPAIGKTFIVSSTTLTMIRAGALGGDVREIEGGWVFPNSIALLLDAHEVRHLAENSRVGA